MIDNKIKSGVLLAPYTTFQIGGPAKFFVIINTKEELLEAINWAKANHENYFILGGGSNLLISDNGFNGLVIKLDNSEIKIEDNKIIAEAGARLSDAVAEAGEAGLSGLEWAAGIPGTVGGAVRGNAGAFGSEMANNLESVEYFDVLDNNFKILKNHDCRFSYRDSQFKQDKNKIIWQVILNNFTPEDKQIINNKALEIINLRLEKHPKYPSAGSVFKNLMPDQALIDKLGAQDKVREGKLASGVVIDELNLKGEARGGAKISEQHGNFIVNHDNAKASDVRELLSLIKAQAKQAYDLDLEEEIEQVGF